MCRLNNMDIHLPVAEQGHSVPQRPTFHPWPTWASLPSSSNSSTREVKRTAEARGLEAPFILKKALHLHSPLLTQDPLDSQALVWCGQVAGELCSTLTSDGPWAKRNGEKNRTRCRGDLDLTHLPRLAQPQLFVGIQSCQKFH